MQTKRQVAANPQTKPTDLGCEPDYRLHPPSLFIIITQQEGRLPLTKCSTDAALASGHILGVYHPSPGVYSSKDLSLLDNLLHNSSF